MNTELLQDLVPELGDLGMEMPGIVNVEVAGYFDTSAVSCESPRPDSRQGPWSMFMS